MLSLLILAMLQSTDFGVRQIGEPVPVSRQKAQAPRKAPAGLFTCSVAAITDGDTLRCTDGTRVRLAGIDAPEISPCAPERKCVSGDGTASRRSLAGLASARTLRCEAVGISYKRIVAFCSAGALDLSCAQVRAGQAVTRYSEKARVCR